MAPPSPGAPPAPTARESLQSLGSSAATGLSPAEAATRLARDGPNAIPEEHHSPVLRLLRKFWGLSAWMLELIAGLSLFLHKLADLGVALALLVVNAILGFVQEQRASSAVAALRHRLQVTARVLRGGAWAALPAGTLVTGDVVRTRAGVSLGRGVGRAPRGYFFP